MKSSNCLSRIWNLNFSNNAISWGICHWVTVDLFYLSWGGGVEGEGGIRLPSQTVCLFSERSNKLQNRGCNNSWNDTQLVNIFCNVVFKCIVVAFNCRMQFNMPGGGIRLSSRVVCLFCECNNKLYNCGCNNNCNNSRSDIQIVNIFCNPFSWLFQIYRGLI